MHDEALPLNGYLTAQGCSNCFVHPIIVFSHPSAKVPFGIEQVKKVSVIQRRLLIQVITAGERVDFNYNQVNDVLKILIPKL
jgi:hypothetical protein